MKVFAIAFLALLAACQSAPVPLTAAVSKAEVSPFAGDGDRSILGQAFLKVQGGGIVTCAGETVTLLPAVPAVDEAVKIWRAGDTIDAGKLDKASVPNAVRYIECDAGGNFAFEKLPPLSFWVMVPVKWKLWDEESGGMLAQKVSLATGSAERLIVDDDDKLLKAKPWQLTPHL